MHALIALDQCLESAQKILTTGQFRAQTATPSMQTISDMHLRQSQMLPRGTSTLDIAQTVAGPCLSLLVFQQAGPAYNNRHMTNHCPNLKAMPAELT